MNMKINTICFILLFFFFISAVSASDSSNETLEITNQPEDMEKLQMSESSDEVFCKSIESKEVIGASINKTPLLSKNTAKSKVKVVMKAPNVKMYYKDGTKFKVTLKDKNKKVMKSAKVKIAINGATYTKKTNSKGIAQLDLNFNSGTYKVVTTYDGSSIYAKNSVTSKVTIKSTIKSHDMTKYYKNKAPFYSTFYNKKGKPLKNTKVTFKIGSKTYSWMTNAKGIIKLDLNGMPGKYSIILKNPKTKESIKRTVTIKTLIQTKDMTMLDGSNSHFTIKILNSNGKANPNQKVSVSINGIKTSLKTDKKGIASLAIRLDPGRYVAITEYDKLFSSNYITVNKVIRHSTFSHKTYIPSSVNVTTPYVFNDLAYFLKPGLDGIINMPKNNIFTIQIGDDKLYKFSHTHIPGIETKMIGGETHLVPFDGGEIKSSLFKKNLKGDGILISNVKGYTEIEYRSTTEDTTELFGLYMDKGFQQSETITYLQNNKIKAKVNFYTYNYDEFGLRYNLAKFYGKSYDDFNYKSYDEVTNGDSDKIKFASTGEPVTFSYFGGTIVGYLTKEDIKTKFIVNGAEQLEKAETISYGLGEKYRPTFGFEVIQSYAILNEKVTANILYEWASKNPTYLKILGINNVYGMFLASLETAYIHDENANRLAKDFGCNWKRENTATILGGINLDDTYIHVLNSDMGMKVNGKNENAQLFRFINSVTLPNIEEYVLQAASSRYGNSTSNSLNNVLTSIAKNNYSITQLGDLMYVFDGKKSAIIVNLTSGVSNVIISNGQNVYKGSSIHTKEDCCSVCNLPNDILNGINNIFKNGISKINSLIDKTHPLSMLLYHGAKGVLGKVLKGAGSVASGLFTTMAAVQTVGTTYRDGMVKEKDWHKVMDTYTFTRPGYLQGKKVYNIPNKSGGYDFVEVKVNNDLSLNRENVKYISKGKTKVLSKKETYQYFTEDYWTPFSMPQKYWDKSWKQT